MFKKKIYDTNVFHVSFKKSIVYRKIKKDIQGIYIYIHMEMKLDLTKNTMEIMIINFKKRKKYSEFFCINIIFFYHNF